MPKVKDLTGKQYGKLTVVSFAGFPKGRSAWACRCDCGNIKIIAGHAMINGVTLSCGCLLKTNNYRHGHRANNEESRTHVSWRSMLSRCYDPNAAGYERYGGRGIKVCERWYSFENFLADMGERPYGKTIDRINNNGHYELLNCEWATPTEQANNKRVRVGRS